MDEPFPDASASYDAADLLPIVVGAHLRAETEDRPMADRLAERIRRWQYDLGVDLPRPIVCTDLWYLNDPLLMQRPTITVGAPEINGATAYLGSRLPTACVVDDTLRIQMDVEHIDLQACIWGTGSTGTAAGVELFEQRYLEGFLREVFGVGVG